MAEAIKLVDGTIREDGKVQRVDASETSKAYKKDLDTPIPYEWNWLEFPTPESAKADGRWLSDADILAVVNRQEGNKARQASLTEALKAAGYEKPTEANDPQIGLRNMVRTLRNAKLPDGTPRYTESAAKALASQALGIAWED
jgi:hypothetical protein